ncbi:MAG: SMI1/KNR4 family protein [Tannerella sp.]|jgi:hypothetical protein|nr:SMI1/KNR4 family protein [Tannerella sp.]
MINLEYFLKNNDVEYSSNRVNSVFIPELERELSVAIGEQLKKYILEYGYLAFKFVELYGITDNQKLNSDMVKKTKFLHKEFAFTSRFVVLEDAGDGDFILIDSDDGVFEFIPESGSDIKPLSKKLFDYISTRFNSIL